MTSRKVRPTVRFGANQYALIQAKLQERNVSFQAYVNELICRDLGVPLEEFEETPAEGQMSLFGNAGNVSIEREDDVTK